VVLVSKWRPGTAHPILIPSISIFSSPRPPCSTVLYILSRAICSLPTVYTSIILSILLAVAVSIGIIPSRNVFFPTPAVAESSVYFQQTSRDNYFTDNIQNITTLYFILFTLRVQYCAWGTPSALSYYYNNTFTLDSTFHIIHITNTTLLISTQARFDSAYLSYGRYSIVFALIRFDSVFTYPKTIFDRHFKTTSGSIPKCLSNTIAFAFLLYLHAN
jgi:hypothetical protein